MTKNKIYSDFTDVLKNNLSLFPLSLADDYLKLCYQNAYGAEHLLLDLSRAKKYFDEEYEEVIPSKNDDLFQSIGNDIIRVNFAKYKYLNFDKRSSF